MRRLIPLSVLLLMACTSMTKRQPAAIVVHEGGQWNQSSLSVCWRVKNDLAAPRYFVEQFGKEAVFKLSAPPDFFRDIIRKAVVKEYSIERVGIEFTGWGLCDVNSNSDLQLLFSIYPNDFLKSISGPDRGSLAAAIASNIGRVRFDGSLADLSKADNQLYIYFSYYTDPKILGIGDQASHENLIRYLSYLLVHEFGHIAGLYHETDDNVVSIPGRRVRRLAPLDHSSVMGFGRSPVLSEGEVHALRCLYKYTTQEKEKKCRLPQ